MIGEMLFNVREKKPLIHNITTYVTANDCANILLACGASPIMADDIGEVEEITSICDGLNINIGTLSQRTIPSMLAAGKKANSLGHPVVFDPVGAGASVLRNKTALDLMSNIDFAVIRGNISEIKALADGSRKTSGVDAGIADKITEANLEQEIDFAKAFSKKTGAVIAITGAIDIIADESTAYCIRNGHPNMSKITGTGCQLSSMITAYAAANREHILTATAAAVCAMGLCGETAEKRMSDIDGSASYRNYLIDAVYNLTPEELEKGARYEMR